MSLFHNFETTREQLADEKAQRAIDESERISFGIPVLDLCLKGIHRGDLVLIGARSGAGKTEIATMIAESVVRSGKKVVFFALEADRREIPRRRLFRRLAARYFADPNRKQTDVGVNFLDWYTGDLDEEFEPYYNEELEAICTLDDGKFFTRYRGDSDFTSEMFEREMASIKDASLVIVDHFHFFDSEPGNENEIHKRLIRQIRDLVGKYRIPIVLIAHLRKSDKRFSQPLPEMEDFMGSSDLYKNPTKIILAAPGPRYLEGSNNQWVTYINIAKARKDGSRTKYAIKTVFDLSTTSYLPSFKLGRFDENVWVDLEPAYTPSWAKAHADIPKPDLPAAPKWKQQTKFVRQIVKEDE